MFVKNSFSKRQDFKLKKNYKNPKPYIKKKILYYTPNPKIFLTFLPKQPYKENQKYFALTKKPRYVRDHWKWEADRAVESLYKKKVRFLKRKRKLMKFKFYKKAYLTFMAPKSNSPSELFRRQSKRLLEQNTCQLVTHLRKQKPAYFKKSIQHLRYNKPPMIPLGTLKINVDRKIFWRTKNNLSKQMKRFKLWTSNNKYKFFNQFWIKYKSICWSNDWSKLRKRVKILNKRRLFKKLRDEGENAPPLNPVYAQHTYVHWQKKFKVFSLPKYKYQRDPWLSPLYHTRKLYRQTRKRVYRREKKPYRLRRLGFYNKFFQLIYPKRKIVYGQKYPRINQLLRRYIILPFFNHMTSKQLKRLVSRVKKSNNILSGDNFNSNFENRLDVLSYKLNFAPTIFWSRVFISMGWIWVSNHKKSIRVSNKLMENNVVYEYCVKNNRNVKFIKVSCQNKINILKSIKNALFITNYSYKNLPKFRNNDLQYEEAQLSPTYVVKQGEIVHVSPYLTKLLSRFFMNKLRKKRTSLYLRSNSHKTAGLLTHPCYGGTILNQDRLSSQYWKSVYSMKNRN